MSDPAVDHLGPLTPLAGTWEGAKGLDLAPAGDGEAETPYRERIQFEPMGPVENGPQVLGALRYSTVAWPLSEDDPFHEEVGYWLWDPRAEQVMRCFMVPRGVTILAGGTVRADARAFSLRAEVGSETFGVLSNPFLDQAFKTVAYDLSVTVHDDGSFSYAEDTILKIPGRDDLFHHTDRNTLSRI